MKRAKQTTKLGIKKSKNKKSATAIPKFRVRFRPALMGMSLILMLLSGSALAYFIHEDTTSKQLNVAPASSQSSADSSCNSIDVDGLNVTGDSQSSCTPDSGSSSTATPAPTQNTSTQSAQTTSPSTVAKPKSSTSPTSYPAVIDGMVWTSPTCHYAAGYGEAYYRNTLVQALWTQQSSLASNVSGLINQYNENGLSTSQETLSTVNNEITIFNSFVNTTYSQYASEVNSIGCTTTINTTNVPQVPQCTTLSGTVCDDSIWAISIPSLE